jgi:hypothetical protein
MLAKFSYLVLGIVIGTGLLIAVTQMTARDNIVLSKTNRLSIPVAPANFVKERFGEIG